MKELLVVDVVAAVVAGTADAEDTNCTVAAAVVYLLHEHVPRLRRGDAGREADLVDTDKDLNGVV